MWGATKLLLGGVLLVLVGVGCEDPEGACELKGKTEHCGEQTKISCEKRQGTFHQGKRCRAQGYTREEGITWFRPRTPH